MYSLPVLRCELSITIFAGEMPVMVLAMDSFRGGGDAAQADAKDSLRSIISMGRPRLFWIHAWVLGDAANDAGTV